MTTTNTGTVSRRAFVKQGASVAAGVAALSAVGSSANAAQHSRSQLGAEAAGDQFAILYDSTNCAGCRMCEIACADANDLGRTADEIFQGRDSEDFRALAPNVFTYVTKHTADESGTVAFGKVQCMHCVDPACARSCPVSALEKTESGPVVWHPELCLGCRYCVLACPQNVPRFEWDSRNPRIRKCEMCSDRQLQGRPPACVEACPTHALIAGTRRDLLVEAHRRIREHPDRYEDHVYGEFEAGGMNVLHLAGYPFEELGYRTDLGNRAYGEYTQPAMAAIPYVMNGLGMALGAVAWVANRRVDVEQLDTGGET